MHRKRVVLIVAGILAVLALGYIAAFAGGGFLPRRSATDERAERIIQNYIEATGKLVKPNSTEYEALLKGILLGEHPELTGAGSPYIQNQEELDIVITYAASHVTGHADQDGDAQDYEAPPAPTTTPSQ